MPPGYFRFPTIYKDTIVFVCEDGDYLLTMNGSAVNSKRSPNEILVNQAKEVVMLSIIDSGQDGEPSGVSKPHNVLVKTLNDEVPARYREWVNNK